MRRLPGHDRRPWVTVSPSAPFGITPCDIYAHPMVDGTDSQEEKLAQIDAALRDLTAADLRAERLESLESDLETVRTALEEREDPAPTDDLDRLVEYYADTLRALHTTNDIELAFLEAIDRTAKAEIRPEETDQEFVEQIDRAVEQYGRAADLVDERLAQGAALEEPSVAEETDSVTGTRSDWPTPPDECLVRGRSELERLGLFLDGFTVRNRGVERFLSGKLAFEQGRYAEADEAFREARRHLETSRDRLAEAHRERLDTVSGATLGIIQGKPTDEFEIPIRAIEEFVDGTERLLEAVSTADAGDLEQARETFDEVMQHLSGVAYREGWPDRN